MKNNPIQFAVVREDPTIEEDLLQRAPGKRALLIASGGCTALTLQHQAELTLLDMNAAQLDLVERKFSAMAKPLRAQAFGFFDDDPQTLCHCGNFESLFRGFRAVVHDLIMPRHELEEFFGYDGVTHRLTSSPYWPVAFSMFFSDDMLEAMFTSAATQHADKGSYARYFQQRIEAGLAREERGRNPWLLHILLGHYSEAALPPYAMAPAPKKTPTLIHAPIINAPTFDTFDLISLSNLFDWMPRSDVDAVISRLGDECRARTVVVVRQLNNKAPVEDDFITHGFIYDEATSKAYTHHDASLFYDRVLVFTKQSA